MVCNINNLAKASRSWTLFFSAEWDLGRDRARPLDTRGDTTKEPHMERSSEKLYLEYIVKHYERDDQMGSITWTRRYLDGAEMLAVQIWKHHGVEITSELSKWFSNKS